MPPRTLKFHAALEAFKREYVRSVLDLTEGNVREAAQVAGVDRSYFYRLMKKARIGVETRRTLTDTEAVVESSALTDKTPL